MKCYALRHLLAKWLHLSLIDSFLETPEEGRGVEFPQEIAILADCTTIVIIHTCM